MLNHRKKGKSKGTIGTFLAGVTAIKLQKVGKSTYLIITVIRAIIRGKKLIGLLS